MRRRTYLSMTAAAAVGFAGCIGSRSSDSDRADTNSTPAPVGESDRDPTPVGDGEPTADDSSSDRSADAGAAGTDDDFEDLSAWDVTGGTVVTDPTRAVVGTQSARLEVPASRGTTQLSKTFAESRDLTDVVPGVAVAADEVVVPWVRLVDVDGQSIGYRRGVGGDLPLMRYNFGIETVETGFDATRVREVHLRIWTAEGDARTVWFDDLHFTPRPETGQVMIQFDDGNVTEYTEALPILESYGYPAATFVNPASLGSADHRLTVDQLHELHDAGWCIGNHTRSHARLPELDAAEQTAEIRAGKEWLVDQGFEDGADYFAYPYGQYDETTLEVVADHHAIGFAAGRPAQGYTTNPILASRLTEPSSEQVRTALERTADRRGITSVLFHQLEGDQLAAFETMIETIHDYESRGDLEVILPSDLEERFLF